MSMAARVAARWLRARRGQELTRQEKRELDRALKAWVEEFEDRVEREYDYLDEWERMLRSSEDTHLITYKRKGYRKTSDELREIIKTHKQWRRDEQKEIEDAIKEYKDALRKKDWGVLADLYDDFSYSLPRRNRDLLQKLRELGGARRRRASRFRKGDIVSYKGRNYRLLWSGSTKYGDRAKLEFMDGTKSFWVDLDRVSPSSGGGGYGRGRGRGRGRSRMVKFRYWNGKIERMSEEDADMLEDMGHGTHY